jgi:adenosylmethionine---8-amino-7-oxononanoate aminotransferase
MSLLILGTDTDAGKTTFAAIWLAAFSGEWAYWKPVETGDSDTERIRRLVPEATIRDPLARFRDPIAPPLAARHEGKSIPSADRIASLVPGRASSVVDASGSVVPCTERAGRVSDVGATVQSRLLIETFGGPFSPLNEDELQIELIRKLNVPALLVCSTALGAVGRCLAMQQALAARGIGLAGIVLLGPADNEAEELIRRYCWQPVFTLSLPARWDVEGVREAAQEQRQTLGSIRRLIGLPGDACNETSPAWENDRAQIWHPYTSLRDAETPLPVVGAQDEFLDLADGRRIIDGISSWWTILHGHREPRLMAALREASQSFDHVLFAGVTHEPAIRVAELLLRIAPWQSGRVFFSDNGSTAVEVALKMAFQYWCHRGEAERTLFIGFENGYHGDTFGSMAVGRDPLFFGTFEPLLFRAQRVPISAERLDDALNCNRGRVGAVILEPLVQGAGGMRMHSVAELRAIFEVTRKHGVLFIADEVMTGCHRTGSMWAFQAAGIAPDLICAAKTLAGGVLPLAATLASPDIVAAFDTADRERTFFHGHSFTAHPLACAIAAVNLELLLSSPPEAPARIEAFWIEAFAPLRSRPAIREVRIRGSIAAIEFDAPGGYLAETARTMRSICLERGVFLRPLGNVLYAMPPFKTAKQSLARIAEAITDCVDIVGRG